jgi:hypothetical protein
MDLVRHRRQQSWDLGNDVVRCGARPPARARQQPHGRKETPPPGHLFPPLMPAGGPVGRSDGEQRLQCSRSSYQSTYLSIGKPLACVAWQHMDDVQLGIVRTNIRWSQGQGFERHGANQAAAGRPGFCYQSIGRGRGQRLRAPADRAAIIFLMCFSCSDLRKPIPERSSSTSARLLALAGEHTVGIDRRQRAWPEPPAWRPLLRTSLCRPGRWSRPGLLLFAYSDSDR